MGNIHSLENPFDVQTLTPIQKKLLEAVQSDVVSIELIKREVSSSNEFKLKLWDLLWQLHKAGGISGDLRGMGRMMFPNTSFEPQRFPDSDFNPARDMASGVVATKNQLLTEKRESTNND